MVRRILIAFTLAVIAVSMLGEETPARIYIERIEVRNARRVSPRLIVAETLLREGKEYSEDDLRGAMARLGRLPFLLSADFALEKGSEGERQILVINVTEMRPVSFLFDARGIELDDAPRHKFDYDFVDPTAEWKDAALGVRWLAGGGGIVHLAMTVRRNRRPFGTNYSAWELGYTRYDLFGTRAFATLNVRTPVDSVSEGTFTPSFVAGIPLTTSQTLTLEVEDTLFRRNTLRFSGVDFDLLDADRQITAAWTYDTTNAPFAPSRGTFVRIAPVWSMKDHASFQFGRPPQALVASALHVNARGFDFTALRHWELSEVSSVFGGILGGWADIDQRQHPNTASSDVRWHPTYEIVKGGYSRRLGTSRLELEGRVVAHQRHVQEGKDTFGADPSDQKSLEAAASWVRRSVWGTLRLGIGYARAY